MNNPFNMVFTDSEGNTVVMPVHDGAKMLNCAGFITQVDYHLASSKRSLPIRGNVQSDQIEKLLAGILKLKERDSWWSMSDGYGEELKLHYAAIIDLVTKAKQKGLSISYYNDMVNSL